ncbi:C4-dicarboxylate ABC transporter permease [Synergistales bacterium]|nr:C4-dicarboxylate ABC transporter permease [Synergistales bacterium]
MLKKLWNNLEEYIGIVLLVVIIGIAFANVVTRYVARYSIAFTEELALYLFVWLTMLGASRAFREGTNMSVTLLYKKFPGGGRKVLYFLSVLFSVFCFASLVYWGTLQVYEEISLNTITESMALPAWIFTVSIPLVSALTIVRIFQRARSDMRSLNY